MLLPFRQFMKTLSLCLTYCTEIQQTGNTMCKMIYNQVQPLEPPQAQVLTEIEQLYLLGGGLLYLPVEARPGTQFSCLVVMQGC